MSVRSRTAASAVALMLCGAGAVADPVQAARDIVFEGRAHCTNRGVTRPLVGARIQLVRNGWGLDNDVLRRTHTDSRGRYRIPIRLAEGTELNVWIDVILNDDIGVNLEDWWTSWDDWRHGTETFPTAGRSRFERNFRFVRDGGRGTPKCAMWQGVHDAFVDYRRLVGSRRVRPDDVTISAGWLGFPTPWSYVETINWPSNHPTGSRYQVSYHEFGHTVRHSLDGGAAHFINDAVRFRYARTHSDCDETSAGFAFNEGWAEYWADDFRTCADPTDFDQEGNVAGALKHLQSCTSRRTLVDVLRANPGAIHSFGEFRAAFVRRTGRTCPPRARAATAPPPTWKFSPPAPAPDASSLEAAARSDLAAQTALVGELRRKLAVAKQRRPARPTCGSAGCEAVARAVAEPSLVQIQIDQAQMIADAMRDQLAQARADGFLPTYDASAVEADQRELMQTNHTIVLRGMQRTLSELDAQAGPRRRGFGLERSALRSRISRLQSAGAGEPSALPPGFTPVVAESIR